MWIITGNLNSGADDQVDARPPVSSHWIRPGRHYRLGRMGGYTPPNSKGVTRARPNDFTVKAAATPKDGAWILKAGGEDWDPMDDPSSDTNNTPYPLVLTVKKPFVLHRAGEQTKYAASDVELQPGDQIVYNEKIGSGMSFEWRPIFICFGSATAKVKKEHAEKAKSMGIKIAFRKVLPHHTHCVVPTVTPTSTLLMCAISICEPVRIQFFDALHVNCRTKERPPASQLPVEPPEGSTEQEYGRFEKQLLQLEPDVGFDWKRWWAHSTLERDWTKMVKPADWRPAASKDYPMYNAQGWAPNEQRKTLFRDILFVSYRGFFDVDETARAVVEAAGGGFLISSLLRAGVTATTLRNEIEAFKKASGVGSQCRVVIIRPKELEDELLSTLRQMAKSYDVIRFIHYLDPETSQAVYDADTSILFGASDDPQLCVDPTAANANAVPALLVPATPMGQESFGRAAQPPATQASFQFTASGVPATHPDEEEQYRQQQRRDSARQGGAEAGPSGEGRAAAAEPAAPAPTGPKRLPRGSRARTRGIEGFFDEDDGFGETTSSARPLRTQDGAPSLTAESTYGVAMDLDHGLDSSLPGSSTRPPPRHGTLKRRADTAAASLFDDPDESMSQPPNKKSREERLREIQEEDERIAQELAAQHDSQQEPASKDKGKNAAPGKDKASGTASTSRKRQASVIASDEDSNASSRVGKSGKTTGKKSAPTPARKRQKSASVRPDSESDDAAEVPVKASAAAKKSAATVTAPTATAKRKTASAAATKAAQAEAAKEKDKLLLAKTSKRKGAEADQVFNEEFNALKIVKPVLQPMKKPQMHRMGWDEVDSEEEVNRMIREDQAREDDPSKWGGKGTQMFVIHSTPLARKDRPQPRQDLELEAKYAGRANFKRFRPKQSRDPQLPRREQAKLELPELPPLPDFGIGQDYEEKRKKIVLRVSDEEDDDDDMLERQQPKLSFGKKSTAATKAKASTKSQSKAAGPSARKGKAKMAISDSEEDELASDTLGDDHDMLVDSDDEVAPPSAQASKGKGRVASAKKVTAAEPAAPKRKPAPAATTIVIDSDDSDDDVGFKGFGSRRK